jgi:hypothetical protein
MFKSISAVILFSAVTMASASNPALSESRPCYSIPKSAVPCIIAPQTPQVPKPQGL